MNTRTDLLFAAIPGACIVIDPTVHMTREQSGSAGPDSMDPDTLAAPKKSGLLVAFAKLKNTLGLD